MYQGRRRKANRRRDFDYSRAGWYFVTVCTQNRECLFGNIENGQMILNEAGLLVQRIWNELPKFYHGIGIDELVIMPNHFHGIIIITNVGTGPRACPQTSVGVAKQTEQQSGPKGQPLAPTGQPQGVVPTRLSLSDVIRNFKSLTTNEYLRQIKQNNWPPFYRRLWQRSFYDHIICNEQSYQTIKRYIQGNPLNWQLDMENLQKLLT